MCGNDNPRPRRTFQSSRRSGSVYSLLFIVFKGTHGLVVPPRHGSFLPVRTDSSGRATEKGLSPRSYERSEIIKCLVGTTKHKKHKNYFRIIYMSIFDTFFLMKKYPKNQERTMLPPHRAKHLARRSFIPPRGYSASFFIYSF